MEFSECKFIQVALTSNNIAVLTLNRVNVGNALNNDVIRELIETLHVLAEQSQLRALLITGHGKHFCAGADLAWMQEISKQDYATNLQDARLLANLMFNLYNFPKPTIAIVQGACYGGGVGLACCCDIVMAKSDAKFCLSEVKIGLIPAVISPYVINALGLKLAKRLMLTAEVVTAQKAQEYNLVDEILEDNFTLDFSITNTSLAAILNNILQNSPQAMFKVKELLNTVAGRKIDEFLLEDTAIQIADIRQSRQGQEGLSAFLEKRKPNW